MPSFPCGVTVTVHQRTVSEQDGYGSDIYATTDVAVAGCAVWPTRSSEDVQARDLVTTGLTALLPAGTTVRAVDQVTVGGLLYDIAGDPATYMSPLTGTAAGVEVQLLRATG